MRKVHRIERERRTVEAMLGLYCRGRHGGRGLCGECQELRGYAMRALDRCPYREDKPVCSKCKIHCYRPEMRERIKAVMRYSGPRMLVHHPILAIEHLMDGLRRPKDASR